MPSPGLPTQSHRVGGERGRPGCFRQEVAPASHRLDGARRVEAELHDHRVPGHGLEAELELGHHPEVAAPAAQPPEQVGVVRRRRRMISPSAVTTV